MRLSARHSWLSTLDHDNFAVGTDWSDALVSKDTSPLLSPNDPGPLAAGDNIADDTSTTTTLALGATLSSSIQSSNDLDYVRITLTAGQTYTFSLSGGTLSDPYLELRDASGALIAQNDDGGITYNSLLMYTAASSGTYYLVARGYDASVTGSYQLTYNTLPGGNSSPTVFTNNGLPQYSWEQAAIQLSREGATWGAAFGSSAVVTYAFRSTAPSTMPSDTGGFSRFSAAQITAAETALAMWASLANITFVRANDGDGYSNNAAILFANYSSGADGAAAFASLPITANTAAGSSQGDVWVNSTLSYNSNPVYGGYGPLVLIHEIGHALGLSHPAEYDASEGSPTYSGDAVYFNDSLMFTVMSYFAETNTGGNQGIYPAAPLLHDIAAIQRLYGANMTTRTGDTIYGFNSNTGITAYTLTSSSTSAVFAIWDAGGTDTLDLSGYNTNSTIDLRQEGFTTAGPGFNGVGMFNIAIARGAVIENAIGGLGADTIIGNSVANRLTGNGGNDSIDGGGGIDTSVYAISSTTGSWHRNPDGTWTVTGVGADTLTSVERLDFTDRDVVLDNAQQTFSGNGTSDILWRNSGNGQVATWEITGATYNSASIVGSAGSEWVIQGTGDFSGDGRDDIVFRRSTDGLVVVWRNGSWVSADFLGAPPTNWVIAGVGDFNFDGKDDFIWRNTQDGAVAVWLMNGGISTQQTSIGGAPLSWQIAGVGDLNGDGADDVLWRHTDGTLALWGTNGIVQTSATIVALVPTQWAVAGLGDFDGDGRADILWRNTADGGVAVWRMDGATQLGASMIGGAPTAWHISDVGDYNGDGRDDILWRHDDGTIALWTMNGFSVANQQIIGAVPTDWTLV